MGWVGNLTGVQRYFGFMNMGRGPKYDDRFVVLHFVIANDTFLPLLGEDSIILPAVCGFGLANSQVVFEVKRWNNVSSMFRYLYKNSFFNSLISFKHCSDPKHFLV